MAVVEFFTVDGVQYMRNGALFCDEFGMELVTDSEKKCVKEAYFNQVKLDELEQNDLKDFIKYARWIGEYEKSKEALFFAYEKYAYDEGFVRMLMPMYVSTCRHQIKEEFLNCGEEKIKERNAQIEYVIDDMEQVLKKYAYLETTEVYTSLLAAACDMGDLTKAKIFADKAILFNGKTENRMLDAAIKRFLEMATGLSN